MREDLDKQQSRWMLAGKIPRVCICLFACIPKLLVPVSLKAKFSCIHPLQKWLVTTVCALAPERAMNCMCYSLFYTHRKCCYLYWYTVMTYQLPHTKDYVSWFQSNLLGWEELSLHNGLMIYVVNMFCLFSGQRQFGLATTRRKSGFLKIGWGGQ